MKTYVEPYKKKQHPELTEEISFWQWHVTIIRIMMKLIFWGNVGPRSLKSLKQINKYLQGTQLMIFFLKVI
jgi:hypothetical protein